MALINLRPWREELRARRQRDFLLALAGCAAVALLLVWLLGTLLEARSAEQQRRNAFLQQQISVIDSEIQEVRELRERRQQLLARMQVIQTLQDNRSVIVRIFDELARTLVDGVYYKRLQRQDNQLVIEGYADDNQQLARLMRRLEESTLFDAPQLVSVAADERAAQGSRFTLIVRQSGAPASKETP